jgi:hypothetical protein
LVKKSKKKNNKHSLVLVLCIIALAVVVVSLSDVQEDSTLRNCPREIQGAENPLLRIQYFDSPTCFYCHLQKGSLKRLQQDYNDSISIERYDIRYCADDALSSNVRGTPGFVFHVGNYSKTAVGMLPEDTLRQIACDVTKKCF